MAQFIALYDNTINSARLLQWSGLAIDFSDAVRKHAADVGLGDMSIEGFARGLAFVELTKTECAAIDDGAKIDASLLRTECYESAELLEEDAAIKAQFAGQDENFLETDAEHRASVGYYG